MNVKWILAIFVCIVMSAGRPPGPAPRYIVYADSNSFNNKESFLALWGYSYPWGPDHNGTARMYDSQVTVGNGLLTIRADRLNAPEGKSALSPFLPINYHSGAIHLKQMIKVSDTLPQWIISGDFQAPVVAGSWPAFWITGVDSWPPESDIMEFKGNATVWQNTITGPDWQHVNWATKKTAVKTASDTWHNYKAILDKVDTTHLRITYYIDDKKIVVNEAPFMNQRFWLVINLQMEGSAGSSGPSDATSMRAKNVYVAALQHSTGK